MKPNAVPPPRRPSFTSRSCETELATLLKLLEPAEKGEWAPIVEDVRIRAATRARRRSSRRRSRCRHRRKRTGALAADRRRRRPGSARRRRAAEQIRLGPAVLNAGSAQIGVVSRRKARLTGTAKTRTAAGVVEGDLWRWDGYTLKAGAATAAASRLVERGRLDSLKTRRTQRKRAPRRPTPSSPPQAQDAMISGEATESPPANRQGSATSSIARARRSRKPSTKAWPRASGSAPLIEATCRDCAPR